MTYENIFIGHFFCEINEHMNTLIKCGTAIPSLLVGGRCGCASAAVLQVVASESEAISDHFKVAFLNCLLWFEVRPAYST